MIHKILPPSPPPLLTRHLNLGGANAHTTITLNSRYLIRDGQPWLPAMAELHFSRVPHETWDRELRKLKAGGIQTVASYVIWIYHEEIEGQFDFTGDNDIRAFIHAAQEAGLDVVLRLGPWCHGEVRNGGFPDWLLEKGVPLRKNHPEYLGYVRRFFTQIYEQIKDLLFDADGNIWAIQIENELTESPEHILALKHMLIEIGLTAPIYTVTGWNRLEGALIPEKETLPLFGGYPDAPWAGSKEALPPSTRFFFLPERNETSTASDLLPKIDPNVPHLNYDLYPFGTCELGSGNEPTYHRRPVISGDDMAAAALVSLGSGNNLLGYYMYHGGCNHVSRTTLQESKATGYPNDYAIISYDFQAPVGAFGQLRDGWRKLRLLHLFLGSWGSLLATCPPGFPAELPQRDDAHTLRCSVRTDGECGFVFFNTYQRLYPLDAHTGVQFSAPTSSGELVFPAQPVDIPSGVYGFFPFNLPLDNGTLAYATVQPLCRVGDTAFFVQLPGIRGEYCLRSADGKEQTIPAQGTAHWESMNLVTLSWEQAQYFSIIDGQAVLTSGADAWASANGLALTRTGDPDLSFAIWDGKAFQWNDKRAEIRTPAVTLKPLERSLPGHSLEEELFLGGEKEVKGWALHISGAQAEDLVGISCVGDIVQIYSGGKLVYDEYYKGTKIQFPAKLTDGCAELWISALAPDDCYLECAEKEGLEVKSITVEPVYNG